MEWGSPSLPHRKRAAVGLPTAYSTTPARRLFEPAVLLTKDCYPPPADKGDVPIFLSQ